MTNRHFNTLPIGLLGLLFGFVLSGCSVGDDPLNLRGGTFYSSVENGQMTFGKDGTVTIESHLGTKDSPKTILVAGTYNQKQHHLQVRWTKVTVRGPDKAGDLKLQGEVEKQLLGAVKDFDVVKRESDPENRINLQGSGGTLIDLFRIPEEEMSRGPKKAKLGHVNPKPKSPAESIRRGPS